MLSEPAGSGYRLQEGEDAKEAAARVCLLFFFFLDGQEEESPWRGINRKMRLVVEASWRFRCRPLHFRRRENFSGAKNTQRTGKVSSIFLFLLRSYNLAESLTWLMKSSPMTLCLCEYHLHYLSKTFI